MVQEAAVLIATRPEVKARDPLHVLAVLARRKGDIFAYTTGQPQSFLVNRPEYVRHVLVDGTTRYSKDTPINTGFADTIADGLLTSEGETWRRQRTLMQPAFARRNTPALAHVVTTQVRRLVSSWAAASDGTRTIDLHANSTRLLFRITAIALFHVDSTPWDGRMTDILSDGLPVLTDESQHPFVVAQHAIWDIAERMVEARLRQRDAIDDVLGRLIRSGTVEADFAQLRDHVVQLALAGYETTASVVTWGSFLLAQHPEFAAQLRAQIREVAPDRALALDDLPALPLLNAFIKETMRLYPPAWIIGRRALQPDRIGGTEIPANSVVAISPYTLHRHPRYWRDPDSFDPRRFLGDDLEHERHPFTYIPFGAGPRTCIGTNFAQVEAPLILGQLLQRFTFDIVEGADAEPRGIFVLVPSRTIRMRYTPV